MTGRKAVLVASVLALAGGALAAAGVALARAGAAAATIDVSRSSIPLVNWTGGPKDTYPLVGHVRLGGQPVARVGLVINGFELPPTNRRGAFAYTVNANDPTRYTVSVASAARATVGGHALDAAQQAALRRAHTAFTVAYRLDKLAVKSLSGGRVQVSGHLAFTNGLPPKTLGVFGYRITGRIVDANGKPVSNAVVATQTPDADSWAFSNSSDRNGNYQSFYWPSGDAPLQLRVAQGAQVWEAASVIKMPHYQSARVDISLPPPNFVMAPPTVKAVSGAVYEGVLVGAEVNGKPVVPASATWPDAAGRFTIVLPRSAHGQRISLYQDQGNFFLSRQPVPGQRVTRQSWPKALAKDMPQDLAPQVAR